MSETKAADQADAKTKAEQAKAEAAAKAEQAKVEKAAAEKLKAVLGAMKSRKEEQAEARAKARRPLSTEQLAKVHQQRLQLATKRGGVKAMRRAVELNAAELEVSPDVYASELGVSIR